jgi:phage portal protein BeeE
VSLLDRWRTTARILTADTMVSIPPWDGHTDQIATLPQEVAQAFGINTTTDSVTFDQAMSIPAVKAGFLSIAGKMGSVPLVCIRERAGNDPERVNRPFLNQPDPTSTRAATVTDTVGDLLFYGLAYWWVMGRDFAGFPVAATRVHPSRVSLDASQETVRVDGVEVDWRNLIAFRGPDRGILYHGGRTLKTALLLEDAVRRYSSLDVPLGLITDDTGAMLEDEVTVFLDSWEQARRSRTTGYLPVGLKYQNPGFNAQQVELSDARGFAAAEIARMLNLPASVVNAPTGDSLTYATTVDNARTLVDVTYAPYRAAVEGRLSMGDITPAGSTVFFDFADFLRGDLSTVIATGSAAVAGGLMTADEVRQQWLHLGPLPTDGSAADEPTAE